MATKGIITKRVLLGSFRMKGKIMALVLNLVIKIIFHNVLIGKFKNRLVHDHKHKTTLFHSPLKVYSFMDYA